MMQVIFSLFLTLAIILCGCNKPKSPLDIIPKLPILIDIGDKEKIVFCCGYDLYAIDPNEPGIVDPDENYEQILLPSPYQEGCPQWLPDGKRFVFSSIYPFKETKFYMIDFNKKRVFDMEKMYKKLLKYGLNDGPNWSLDCKKIIFSGGDSIYIADANGDNIKKIVDIPSDEFASSISFFPDSKRILFSFQSLKDKTKKGIYRMDIATRKWNRLTYNNIIKASHPCCSPDGSKIVFEGRSPSEKWQRIYIMDADGGNLHRLTKDDDPKRICEWQASWSPDSKKVVFTGVLKVKKNRSRSELFIVNVDTRKLEQLTYTSKTSSHSPSWRPRPKFLK
ncbi:MAG: hypothetical protein AB1630_12695 [bacterium]